MVVVIRNAVTDNKLLYTSRLPEMARRLFILLIVRVIRYTLLIDFKLYPSRFTSYFPSASLKTLKNSSISSG